MGNNRYVIALLLGLVVATPVKSGADVVFLLDSSDSMSSPPQLGSKDGEPRSKQVNDGLLPLSAIWPLEIAVQVRFWGGNLWQHPTYHGHSATFGEALARYQVLPRDQSTFLGQSLVDLNTEMTHCNHVIIVTDEITSDLDKFELQMPLLLESNSVTILVVDSVHTIPTVNKYRGLKLRVDHFTVMNLSKETPASLLAQAKRGLDLLPGICATIG